MRKKTKRSKSESLVLFLTGTVTVKKVGEPDQSVEIDGLDVLGQVASILIKRPKEIVFNIRNTKNKGRK